MRNTKKWTKQRVQEMLATHGPEKCALMLQDIKDVFSDPRGCNTDSLHNVQLWIREMEVALNVNI